MEFESRDFVLYQKWPALFCLSARHCPLCSAMFFFSMFFKMDAWCENSVKCVRVGSPAKCILSMSNFTTKNMRKSGWPPTHSDDEILLAALQTQTLQTIAPGPKKTHHNKPLPPHIPPQNENSVHEAQFPIQSSTLLQHWINSSPQLEKHHTNYRSHPQQVCWCWAMASSYGDDLGDKLKTKQASACAVASQSLGGKGIDLSVPEKAA